MITRGRLVSIIASLLLAHITAAAAGDELKPVSVSIPAQPMRAALAQLAEQTGLQLIYPSDIAEHLTAPALNGSYTPRAALERLLADSPLAFEFLNDRTAAISSTSRGAASGPVSGAKVAPADSNRGERYRGIRLS